MSSDEDGLENEAFLLHLDARGPARARFAPSKTRYRYSPDEGQYRIQSIRLPGR